MHIQFNDNCSPTEAVLVWNAVNSGGTANIVPSLAAFDPNYINIAWRSPLPGPGPNFVVDEVCARRCGINATAINGYPASQSLSTLLKNKLAQAPSRIFSAEQVAAADATALFGKGVKQVAQNDAVLAAQTLASKTNRTFAG